MKDRAYGLMPEGFAWIMVRLDIHFRAELRWPGRIELGLAVASFGRTSVTFDQAVFSEGKCVASARAVTVLIDEKSRKPMPLTAEVIENFQPWLRCGVSPYRLVARQDDGDVVSLMIAFDVTLPARTCQRAWS